MIARKNNRVPRLIETTPASPRQWKHGTGDSMSRCADRQSKRELSKTKSAHLEPGFSRVKHLARSLSEFARNGRHALGHPDRGIMNGADQLLERTQHVKLLLCSILFTAFLLHAHAADCPSHQGKEAEILIQIEQSWAAALELRDADAVGCILADEFQDVDPSGALHGRAETLAQIPNRRSGKKCPERTLAPCIRRLRIHSRSGDAGGRTRNYHRQSSLYRYLCLP